MKRVPCMKCPGDCPQGYNFCGQCTREHRAAGICERCGTLPVCSKRSRFCTGCQLSIVNMMTERAVERAIPTHMQSEVRAVYRDANAREDRNATRSGE